MRIPRPPLRRRVSARQRGAQRGLDIPVPVRVAGAGEDPVYFDERAFNKDRLNPGYRIPLPRGKYRVKLHFDEIWFRIPGSRVFDIRIEGKTAAESFAPLKRGYAVPSVIERNVEVHDGLLEIELVSRIENPHITALEVERLE